MIHNERVQGDHYTINDQLEISLSQQSDKNTCLVTDMEGDKLQENLAPLKQQSKIETIKLKLKLSEELPVTESGAVAKSTPALARRQPTHQERPEDNRWVYIIHIYTYLFIKNITMLSNVLYYNCQVKIMAIKTHFRVYE